MVSVAVFIILFSLSVAPLTRSYWEIEFFFVCHVKLFITSLSDHCSVDFCGKGRVF